MPRGRPARKYPETPRIDATPEQLARAIMSAPPLKGSEPPTEYRCVACERVVCRPEILYDDGRCYGCHTAPVG